MDVQRAVRLDVPAAAAYTMDKIFLRLPALPVVDQLAIFEENGRLINIAADHNKSISEAFDKNRLARAWRPILLANMQVDGDIENSDANPINYSLMDTFLDEPVSNVAYCIRAFFPKRAADLSLKLLNAGSKFIKIISSLGFISRFALADVTQGFARSSGAFRFLTWSSDANYKLAYGDRHDRIFMHFFTPECSFDKILSHTRQRNVTGFAFHPMLDSFVAVCCESTVILWRLDFTEPAVEGRNQRQTRRIQQQQQQQRPVQRSVRAIIHKLLTNRQAKPFTSVCFSCEGTLVFACSPSYGVNVWDLATGALVRVVNNLLQPVEIVPCADGLLNGFRSLHSLLYVGDQYESLNYCAIPSINKKRITSVTWYPYGPTLFVTLEKSPLLYTLDFSAPVQWRNRYEISITSTETMLNPIADFEPVQFGNSQCVGGCPKKIVFDLTGRRMALMLEPLSMPATTANTGAGSSPSITNGASYVWLFDVRINTQFCSIEFNPIGGVSSPMGKDFDDYPQLMSMKNNFETGALLTIGWKSGAVSHLPMAFDGCDQNMWREFQEHPNVVMRSTPLTGSAELLSQMMRTAANNNNLLQPGRSAANGNAMHSNMNVAAAVANDADIINRQSPILQQRNASFLHDPRQAQLSGEASPPPPTSQLQHANPFINRMNIQPSQQQPQPSSPLNGTPSSHQWNKTMLLNNSPLQRSFLANATAAMSLSRSPSPSAGNEAALKPSDQAQQFPESSFNPFQMMSTYQRQPYTNVHSGTMSPSITTNWNNLTSNNGTTFPFPASFTVPPNNSQIQRTSPMSISPSLLSDDATRAGSTFENNYSPTTARLQRPLRPSSATLTMSTGKPSQLTGGKNNFMQSSANRSSMPSFGASQSTPLQQQLLMQQHRLAEAAAAGNSFTGFGASPSILRNRANINSSSSMLNSSIGTPLAMSTPLDSAAHLSDTGSGDNSLLNFGLRR